MSEDGIFTMLKGIKEKSADQEARIANLETRNSKLKSIQNGLRLELEILETDLRDRHILINKLYNLTTKTMVTTPVIRPQAQSGPSREEGRQERAKVEKEIDSFLDDSTARKARENAERRSRLRKPICFMMKTFPGGCQLGAKCPESHDVIPVGYCRAFNDTGHCDAVRCKDQHKLYNYTPTEAELATAYIPRADTQEARPFRTDDRRDLGKRNGSPDRGNRSRSRSPSPKRTRESGSSRATGRDTSTRKRSRDFFDKREDSPDGRDGRDRGGREDRRDRGERRAQYSSDESFERERRERQDRERRNSRH